MARVSSVSVEVGRIRIRMALVAQPAWSPMVSPLSWRGRDRGRGGARRSEAELSGAFSPPPSFATLGATL